MGISAEARDPANLWDLLTSLKRLQRMTASATRDALLADSMIQGAVERCVTLIGAAAARVSDQVKQRHPAINWAYLADLGRRTREEYDRVNYDELWKLVRDVGSLIREVEPLLPPPPSSLLVGEEGGRLPADLIAKRLKIQVDPAQLAKFCRTNHIARLWLFGSVLREDFSPESDVDVLVDFEPDARVSLSGLVRAIDELSELLGRKVDLIDRASIANPFVRQDVLRTRRLAYAA